MMYKTSIIQSDNVNDYEQDINTVLDNAITWLNNNDLVFFNKIVKN
jgi:hypothetical protein